MLNFDFLEKSLGIVSSRHFVRDFQEKYISCYILLTDQISLWVEIASEPGCDVINFEINLIFPVFFYTINQRVKTKT